MPELVFVVEISSVRRATMAAMPGRSLVRPGRDLLPDRGERGSASGGAFREAGDKGRDTMTDLHCDKRLHGKFTGGVLEIHCRRCSRVAGRPVLHRWELDAETGDLRRVADGIGAEKPALVAVPQLERVA
jgi:hypothetical protein